MGGVPFRGIGERRVEETLPPARPEVEVEPVAADTETVRVRYSWYWPPLGGINTSRPDAPHLARCANGDRWQDWVGAGIACPPSWAFGTQVRAFGSMWTCVDRGGAIQYVNGIPWLDFLVEAPHVGYGTIIEVEVVGP